MKSQKLRYVLLIIVAGLIGYYAGVSKIAFDWNKFQPHIDVASKEPPPSLQFGDANRMWAVLDKLENNFYDRKAIDSEKALNGAIAGMVASLDDPYTVYLPPQQNTDFKQGLAGKFEGIGAELGLKDKNVIVVAPLDGSPAQKAGIKAGDLIVKVDGQYVNGLSLNQVVDKIRGPKGTTVKINVQHKSGEQPVDVNIVRDTITVKSLTTWIKNVKDIDSINTKDSQVAAIANDKVIYIRLSQFGDNTNEEWAKIAADSNAQLQKDKSIKGIVFDLRNNPGGYLNDAVYIVSEFVKDGDAVLQEDKNGKRTGYPVTGKGVLTDVPVVVLLNKGSASASEITAGALRDHGRAKIVGENSFGKGTIQQAEDLGNGAGLHITIAKWLTPNGTWVGNGKNGQGLKPDVAADLDTKDPSHDSQLEKGIVTLVNP
jgi:carboxyl-terminal processing protease